VPKLELPFASFDSSPDEEHKGTTPWESQEGLSRGVQNCQEKVEDSSNVENSDAFGSPIMEEIGFKDELPDESNELQGCLIEDPLLPLSDRIFQEEPLSLFQEQMEAQDCPLANFL